MLDMTYEQYLGETFKVWLNGALITDYFHVLEVTGRSLSPNEIKSLIVPRMNGSHFQSKRKPGVPLGVKGFMVCDSDQLLRQRIDELNGILDTEDAVSLVFSDEPNKTYFGMFNDVSEGVEVNGNHIFTISFARFDPHKYAPEQTAILGGQGTIINVSGTAPTSPIFELDVTAPTTYILVSNDKNEYMMIGNPANIEQQPYQKYERIFYTDANSLVGWANANSGEIDGVVAGTMETNGTRFQASSFGTGTGWHGPAIKQSLTESLTNFRLEAFIALYNEGLPEYVGRDEVYLLDASGNQICKLAMKDTQIGRALGFGEARIGAVNDGYYLINESGDREGVWNDYFGIVRIERNNNKWSAYFAMVDSNTGKHHTRRDVPEWEDKLNQYGADATQIVVHFGQYGTHQVPAHGLYSASVYKINNQPDAIPYIAESGDKVTFNHQTNELLINGEPVKKLKDFGATYFNLIPGENTIAILGADSGACKYRPAYK